MTLALLRPLFCYSHSRHAWILRGIGRRYGPVLVEKELQPFANRNA